MSVFGRLAVLGTVLVGSGCASSPSPPVATTAASNVHCGANKVDLKTVESITRATTFGEIKALLGRAPERNDGRGLITLQWPCTDGRSFYVSLTSLQPEAKPETIGFLKE